MRKYILATTALLSGFSGVAFAQDDGTATVNGITIYGNINEGVTWQNHATPSSPYLGSGLNYVAAAPDTGARFSVATNPLGGSIIGIKGAADIGDGFIGVFKADTGFNPTSGTITDATRSLVLQNGLPISRQGTSADGNRDGQAINGSAYVGVSSARYGTLTIGRQNTFQLEGISNYDPMGAAFAFSLIGIVGATAGAGATEETRWDNSIKYLYEYGPLHFGAMYQAPGTIGGAGNDFGYAFDVGGNFAGLSVDSIYTEKHDATLSAPLTAAQVATDPLNSLAVKVADTTAYTLLAKYNLERFTFYVGTSYMILADPANSLAAGDTLTGGYDIGTVVNNAFLHHRDLVSSWGGIKYALTDRLDVTGAFYDFTTNAFGTGGLADCRSSAISAQCSGKFFTTSALLDYRLSKRFDTFIGVAYSQLTGGFAFGALHNNTVDPTIGGRFTF